MLSRHPNYFGECLFWWGIYLMSVPCEGITAFALLGPVHTTLALLFFAGVLGGNERQKRGVILKLNSFLDEISEYEKNTSVFIPLPQGIGRYLSNEKYDARNRKGWGLGMRKFL